MLDLASEVKVAFVSLQAASQALVMRKQILQSTEVSYDAAQRLHKASNITDLSLANDGPIATRCDAQPQAKAANAGNKSIPVALSHFRQVDR